MQMRREVEDPRDITYYMHIYICSWWAKIKYKKQKIILIKKKLRINIIWVNSVGTRWIIFDVQVHQTLYKCERATNFTQINACFAKLCFVVCKFCLLLFGFNVMETLNSIELISYTISCCIIYLYVPTSLCRHFFRIWNEYLYRSTI